MSSGKRSDQRVVALTIGALAVGLHSCRRCGALLLTSSDGKDDEAIERHREWHKALDETAQQAADADLRGRPIG